MFARFIRFTKDLTRRLVTDDCTGMAAEMSYHLMLALAPTLIFVVSILGLIGQQQEGLIEFLEFAKIVLPQQVYDLFNTMMTRIIGETTEELAIVSLFAALWIGSNAASVAIKSLYRAFGFEKEYGRMPYFKLRGISIAVIVSIGGAVFLGSNLMVLGELMTDTLIVELGVNAKRLALGKLINGVLFAVLITGFSLLFYRTVPGKDNFRLPWSCAWPGAITFTVLWVVLSWLFGMYVENLSRYGEFYGALTAVTVMLVWLYMTGFAFLVGGQINARCLDKFTGQLPLNFNEPDT